MEKIINKKILVIGVLFLLLGASAMLGASASNTTPGMIQITTPAINKQIVAQTTMVGNVKISPNAGNDFNPRMTTNALGDIIIVYEEEADIFTKDIPVVFSADDGATWTQAYLFNSLDFQGSGLLGYPDIIYNPAQDQLWFAAVDPNAEMYNNEMYFIPGNIAAGGDALGYAISGTSSSGYLYCAVTHTNDYFQSITTEDYGGDLEQIYGLGWFMYPDFAYPAAIGGYYYDGNSLIRIAPVSELEADYNANRWFIVAESGAGEAQQICIKSGTTDKALIDSGEQQNAMDKYGDIEQMPGEFLGLGTDPDVSGSGSNVVVVFVRDGNVLCSRSSCVGTYEPEFSWQTTTVETGASTPAVYMQGNNVYVAYVKNGNLYYEVSEDGGATFGEAQQKNDQAGTVVAMPGAVDVCKLGIAFVDNRNGNNDIYFAEAKGAAAPEIAIGAITGGIGVSAVIKNDGNAAATDVDWSITTEGTVFIGKEKSGTIATLNPGDEVTIKTGLMLGFGAITVTVKADTATKSQDFKLLLIFVS